MAGGHHGPEPLTRDPAIDKHFELRENYNQYFKWTKKTGRQSAWLLAVIPGLALWAAYKVEGKVDFAGKRRGDQIWGPGADVRR
ncbi:uncharacterized protein V1510DRAFT_429597 [Dipodascopsis tothii]|uniref:uncharacterized protein n=1 Tax=Dipodascopsis tothii TaxID=44089 RepID=UPI0034CE0693